MIKLLIVDDSALMRRLLSQLFEAEGDFEVLLARDGAEALEKLRSERPDVITLDVQMPHLDGLTCLDRIMLERPTPVVMASAVTTEGATAAMRAIDLGAIDFVAKPAGALSLRMDVFGPPLVEKVRAAAQAHLPKTRRLRERLRALSGEIREPSAAAAAPTPRPPSGGRLDAPPADGLVVIGASTGGPPALDLILGGLPVDFPWPVTIAQHMPAAFTGALARRLNGLTPLTVEEVSEPTPLRPGHAYVARGDADMIISRRGKALVAMSAPASPSFHWHPSVDRLTDSALSQLRAAQVVGVLLTGMGNDGAAAMGRLREGGGHTIAEAEDTAVVWGMPGALVRSGGASQVAGRDDIAALVAAAVTGA